MRLILHNKSYRITQYGFVLTVLLLIFPLFTGTCQEPPPRPVTVTATNPTLSFGAFTQGAVGGSVTITATGSRSSTGDIILLGLGIPFAAGHFEIVGNQGTVISLLNSPDVSIGGSNGGSLLLHISGSDPVCPFIINTIPPVPTLMTVGGVLTVGNPASNPPGNYTGTYNITFIQE